MRLQKSMEQEHGARALLLERRMLRLISYLPKSKTTPTPPAIPTIIIDLFGRGISRRLTGSSHIGLVLLLFCLLDLRFANANFGCLKNRNNHRNCTCTSSCNYRRLPLRSSDMICCCCYCCYGCCSSCCCSSCCYCNCCYCNCWCCICCRYCP